MEQIAYTYHLTEDAAEAHARALRDAGWTAAVGSGPDTHGWLVTARRWDGDHDGHWTVERMQAFRP